MKHLAIAALIAFTGLLCPAWAIQPVRADPISLTNAQVLELYGGLTALDGYDKVVKEGGTERVVKASYTLSGGARLAISHDMVLLRPAQQAYQDAVQHLRSQYLADGGLKPTADGKALEGPKLDEFTAQVRQMLDTKQDFPLQKLNVSDLRLEDNPGISGTVLTALQPILDDR